MKRLLSSIAGAACLALAGCTYYVPATYSTPANFDRSFSAASGAMRDNGVAVTFEDPGRGVIQGNAGGGMVSANVLRQADGSVRVQFDAHDVGDRTLIDRVSRSYDQRMGR